MEQALQSREILALLIVIAGFLVAFVISKLVVSGSQLLQRQLQRLAPDTTDFLAVQENATGVSRIVFYVVLAFFLLISMRTAGLTVNGELLDSIIAYVPKLILGTAIILAGYLLGLLTKRLVNNLIGVGNASAIPRFAQYLVVITAVVTGLGQMAVNVSFVSTLIIILLAAVLGSLSLAFSLGARQSVENILARRELEKFQVGDVIRVLETEGTISELTSTGIILETSEGKLHLPASVVTKHPVLQKPAEM